ncbi:She9 / Mdm33 family-domain containing protein [Rhodotorula toruloides]|uniref:Sensitive to high expression protein 9, mitochondrial n=1 Tax=Rhodotorula toruloides TaxID=5286 RepID=A0A2T0AHZ4_RHOTO|nr:She9 / Mdm33 family-domain containing protein [Rhodotorula toruloides]
MSLRLPLAQSCRACLHSSRQSQQRLLVLHQRPFSLTPRRADAETASSANLASTGSAPAPQPSRAIPLPPPSPQPSSEATAHSKLVEARELAHKQLRHLLATLDSSARKQAQAFSAALRALELERKLREAGAKINQATGYEEIERLRNGVAEKERALLEARERAILFKRDYTERVKLRADSQREVNDLLQRKPTWNGPDVLRFTELVQQEHENERAEAKAKSEMEAGEEAVERGFSDLMQAILERYHEEQVWSDKVRPLVVLVCLPSLNTILSQIRSMSTYGSLAITGLNVLLFIITLLLIEPWRRRRLVQNVEERLRTNSQQGHDATQAQLETLQHLLQQTQASLDAVAATTAGLAAPPPAPPSPIPVPETPFTPVFDSTSPEAVAAASSPASTETTASPTASQQPHSRVVEQALAAVEGHEVWAAGAAGAVGGIAIAALVSLLGR